MAMLALSTGAALLQGAVQSGVRGLISGLFAENMTGARLDGLELQTSTEGAFIPIVYGRMRVAGQVIWASRFTEHEETQGGGKSGPSVTQYRYSVSLAVGLCEGPIAQIGRIWANGAELDQAGLTLRVHAGSEDQQPDGLIEAIEGAGQAPAYRGLAYVVLEDLALEKFGNFIPNLAFEVIRAETDGGLDLVEGVCLIPGSGEFAYATEPVMRKTGEGREASENRHTNRAHSDIEAALDDLEAALPGVGSVALVTSWFGTDRRCGQCEIRPGVERVLKDTRPLVWRAAGEDRATAWLVSESEGGPAYGGTPSDETVVAAIRALKARGFSVTLYPFILMDIPAGNALDDPYRSGPSGSGTGQPAYPWRGRITCNPAPGVAGSPENTPGVTPQIEAFFGAAQADHFTIDGERVIYAGPAEWGFNRFILHHCALAKAAGGVDTMLIGSEMRALTTLRAGAGVYPAVERLRALAGEAREITGADTALSYAADWSEYFGHQPQDGSNDVIFHLDPLWSDGEIDFVGIDWYAPLADWREGEAHADAARAGSIHDLGYLRAQVEGGEGYDWYYASAADREAQLRTPIEDGAHGEDWVFRYKDLRGWWVNAHHDRPGGVRQASPTGWVPQGKPIRLIELGCPAVDKGANQPNVFIDPKSSESVAPYHSRGTRDDLIQRRFLQALLGYWRDHNPVSAVYGGPMIDLSRSQVWTWDARPFPEFPVLQTVWRDSENWRLGHWLTGRAGQSSLAAIVADIARRCGLEALDVSAIDGLVAGFAIDRPERGRDVLARLGAIYGFDLADRADGPAALAAQSRSSALDAGQCAERPGEGPVSRVRDPDAGSVRALRLGYIRDDGEYRPASVSALGLDLVEGAVDLSARLLADDTLAAGLAAQSLSRLQETGASLRLTLPPSQARLEAGDVVRLTDEDAAAAGVWRVASVDGLAQRDAVLQPANRASVLPVGSSPQGAGDPVMPPAQPILTLMDLPAEPGREAGRETGRGGFVAAAHGEPWAGELVLFAGADAASLTERARLSRRAVMGELLSPLAGGPEGRWDRASTLSLRLYRGQVSSGDRLSVLGGANRLAIEGPAGWEIVQFQHARLEEDGSWTLTTLLRGLGGSATDGAAAGARIVVLDGASAVVPVHAHEAGADLLVRAVPAGGGLDDPARADRNVRYTQVELRPLNPVHLRASIKAGALSASWIRRSRTGGEDWGAGETPLGEAFERYRVRLLDPAAQTVWSQEVDEARLTIGATQLVGLLPGGITGCVLEVAQVSDVYGPGRPARIAL